MLRPRAPQQPVREKGTAKPDAASPQLTKKYMSVGIAAEYLALLSRVHGTVTRLHVAAKKYYQDIRSHALKNNAEEPPKDVFKRLLHLFPNDKAVLKRIMTWSETLRFLERKLSTIKDRFQYLADEADVVLNDLSKKASLDNPASLHAFAEALETLRRVVKTNQSHIAGLLRANQRFQQGARACCGRVVLCSEFL